MEKNFVPYKQSLDMKSIGFDELCFGFYDDIDNNKPIGGNFPCDGRNSAPTFSQCFRFFREEYEIYSSINSFHCVNSIKPFGLQIDYFVKGIWSYYETDDEMNFKTYKEAELECLKKLIEIVKTK